MSTGIQGSWYSVAGKGATTPVVIVADPGTGKAIKVLKTVTIVSTPNAGDSVSIQDSGGTPKIYAAHSGAAVATHVVDTTDSFGGSANTMAESESLNAVFTGTTARYTIKVLAEIVDV